MGMSKPPIPDLRRLQLPNGFVLSQFKRAWIVQEIGTKAPATLFWGKADKDWLVLHRVCEKPTDCHHLRNRFDIRTADIKCVFSTLYRTPSR